MDRRKISDVIKHLLEEIDFSTSEDFYTQLYADIILTGIFDKQFSTNYKALQGNNYASKMSHILEFSFDDCCTLITYLLMIDRVVEGTFARAKASGDVKSLLERAYSWVIE